MAGGATATSIQPQAQAERLLTKPTSLRIGIPRERHLQERRVPLIPSAVATLTARGYEVLIEHRAGEYASFSDREYTEAGALVVYSPEEVYAQAECIVKIAPPTERELNFLRPKQILFSAVHMGSVRQEYIRALLDKNVTAIGYEFLQAKDGSLPIMRMMSEIAGYAAIQIAAGLLAQQGQATLLGGITGIPPARVLILGAGTVALNAARAALGFGCSVTVLDEEVYRLQRLKAALGHPISTGLIQPELLRELLPQTDVLIGALYRKGAPAHLVVTADMVSTMAEGSVIIDVAIDQGGNIETSVQTTHDLPTFVKYGVIHYCVPNIPSRVPRTASIAFSNVLLPLLLRLSEYGGIRSLLAAGHMLKTGVYTYGRHLTNHTLARLLQMESLDVELLVI
ncbi:MAG: alanine dehydrogenase [Bacteroidia bacterium]|nr:alanine dehydrogenase [Bacteroidia bacterium]MDW8014689.1 alanine dehydrogenase [Bacteroidia bacterium]